MNEHRHTGAPTLLEQQVHSEALDHGGELSAADLAGVEDFRALARVRLDHCVECRDRLLERSVTDPHRAGALLVLCLVVVNHMVGARLVHEGMSDRPETMKPFADLIARNERQPTGTSVHLQATLAARTLAELDMNSRVAFLSVVTKHVDVVMDVEVWLAKLVSSSPEDRPFKRYAEYLATRP